MKSLLATAVILVLAAAPLAAQSAASFQVERTGSGRPMILIPGLLSSGEVSQRTVERVRGTHGLHVLTLAGFAGMPASGADPFLLATRDRMRRSMRATNSLIHAPCPTRAAAVRTRQPAPHPRSST